MKTITILHSTAALLLALSPQVHGRLGETPQQCDMRYGEAAFKYSKGDFDYRSYTFNGKQIQATFYKRESVLESVVSGPHAINGEKHATKLLAEFMSFLRGLLANAYQFTESEIQGLTHVAERNGHKVVFGPAKHGELRAVYWFETSEAEDSIKFTAILSKPPDDPEWQRIVVFHAEGQTLEGKSQERQKERQRANGF